MGFNKGDLSPPSPSVPSELSVLTQLWTRQMEQYLWRCLREIRQERKEGKVSFSLKSIAHFRAPRARHQTALSFKRSEYKDTQKHPTALLSSKYPFVTFNERKLISITSIISSKSFTPLRDTPGSTSWWDTPASKDLAVAPSLNPL